MKLWRTVDDRSSSFFFPFLFSFFFFGRIFFCRCRCGVSFDLRCCLVFFYGPRRSDSKDIDDRIGCHERPKQRMKKKKDLAMWPRMLQDLALNNRYLPLVNSFCSFCSFCLTARQTRCGLVKTQ